MVERFQNLQYNFMAGAQSGFAIRQITAIFFSFTPFARLIPLLRNDFVIKNANSRSIEIRWIKNNQFAKRTKSIRSVRGINSTDGILSFESPILYFISHESLITSMPVAIDLCKSADDWKMMQIHWNCSRRSVNAARQPDQRQTAIRSFANLNF